MLSQHQQPSSDADTGERPGGRLDPARATDEEEPTERSFASDDETVDELLELFSDGYARELIAALSDEPRSARELVESSEMSRATVYRRLNRLQEHDLVSSSLAFHPDGHHRKVFEVTFESFVLDLVDDVATVTIEVEDGDDTTTGLGARAR